MADEIQLISDDYDHGLAVLGEPTAVERFLDWAGLQSVSEDFRLDRLRRALDIGAEVADKASEIAANSGRYLKLTEESFQHMQQLGLIPTETPGISYAMLGERGWGGIREWVQVENGPGALLTNPAVLEGIGGLMTQFARQAEAAEFKALLLKMDEKLDDVRREQKNQVLAKLRGARRAIEEAMDIREHGGHGETAWGKIETESGTILEVQESALGSLGALADKLEHKNKVGKLAEATREIEGDARMWLAVLTDCFQLQDEFRILELDHVLEVAPASLDGHRSGLHQAQQKRFNDIVGTTARLIDRMYQAGAFADSNVLLHKRAAQSVVDSVNSTAAIVHDFHAPLGIEARRAPIEVTRWRNAIRDRGQLKNAGVEAGKKTAIAGITIVGTVVALAVTKEAVEKVTSRMPGERNDD